MRKKRNHDINEISDREFAAVDRKHNRGDQRSDLILHEHGYDRTKCNSDNDADRHVYDIAPHQDLETLHDHHS